MRDVDREQLFKKDLQVFGNLAKAYDEDGNFEKTLTVVDTRIRVTETVTRNPKFLIIIYPSPPESEK